MGSGGNWEAANEKPCFPPDKHFARAKGAGAKVLEEPADTFYGERRYGVTDPEGHQWFFAHVVKEMTIGEMKKAAAAKG